MADHYHPPLPEPVIEYEPDKSSYFYIDSATWTVHLNTAGVPVHLTQGECEAFMRSVSQHEIQHYVFCPYDGVSSGMMFAAASRHLSSDLAMFTCNLFADLVVDSRLLKKHQALTYDRIVTSIHDAALRTHEHSQLWTLTVATYRMMWGFPLPPTCNVDDRTAKAATEIVGVARECLERETQWPVATEKIAKIVKEWLPKVGSQESSEGLGLRGKASGGASSTTDQSQKVADDIDRLMGNPLEVRNGDMAKRCIEGTRTSDSDTEMERLAREVEQRGGSLRDLRGVLLLAGMDTKGRNWTRFWYRAKARGMVSIDVREQRPSGSLPLSQDIWRLGDPIEELDIVQSLQAFPVIVPNMSTRKWKRTELLGNSEAEEYPDLLIVIDSSGSMTWSMTAKRVSGPYHMALLSAFAAVEFAFKRNQRVAVINFSDDIRTCTFTRSRQEVEDILLSYQGGGTVAPVKDIARVCGESEGRVLVLVMTDADIANWDQFVDSVERLSAQGHQFYVFHIGEAREETLEALRTAGASAVPVTTPKDLCGIVIREVGQLYRRWSRDQAI
ncbi:MAG: VWA domain-containing protein [Candidatus Thorarchaeota archaeon]|nr:VWA domain-containing protein [Candidatus Thorarchaeota archaeon]